LTQSNKGFGRRNRRAGKRPRNFADFRLETDAFDSTPIEMFNRIELPPRLAGVTYVSNDLFVPLTELGWSLGSDAEVPAAGE
jgi:hypothetical protein